MDTGRRHETPGPETKDPLSHTAMTAVQKLAFMPFSPG